MQSIKINNYKNLVDIELNSLKRVNLIVGNNNVGKSTLLEAIMLLTTEGNMAAIQEVLDIRGELYNPNFNDLQVEKQMESFTSLISHRNLDLFMDKGVFVKSQRDNIEKQMVLKIVGYIESREDDINQSVKRKLLDYKDFQSFPASVDYGLLVKTSQNDEAREVLYPFNRRLRTLLQTQAAASIQYVKTTQITKDENASLFDKIALTESEKEIIRALNIIEPEIDAINFLQDEYKLDSRLMRDRPELQRVPFVVYKYSTQRYRLSSMGDGINRVLTIILALLNSKNGYLLIDEFDSGLHYSVQTKLWEIVYSLSEELNVQVFATTHSSDCIKSFVEADGGNNGMLIRLEDIEGIVTAIPFTDKERLKFAMDQNIEIR